MYIREESEEMDETDEKGSIFGTKTFSPLGIYAKSFSTSSSVRPFLYGASRSRIDHSVVTCLENIVRVRRSCRRNRLPCRRSTTWGCIGRWSSRTRVSSSRRSRSSTPRRTRSRGRGGSLRVACPLIETRFKHNFHRFVYFIASREKKESEKKDRTMFRVDQ